VELRDETVPADVSGVLYNVVYTGSNRLAPRPGDGGTVKIEVDLREVSKLYPTLSSRNPELMKVIGQNLIDGVRVREDGEVEVDRSKITPELLRVVENSVG
jgi:hypothetical protein